MASSGWLLSLLIALAGVPASAQGSAGECSSEPGLAAACQPPGPEDFAAARRCALAAHEVDCRQIVDSLATGTVSGAYAAAYFAYLQGETERATELLRPWIEPGARQSAPLLLLRGLLADLQGRPDDALPLFVRAYSVDPSYGPARDFLVQRRVRGPDPDLLPRAQSIWEREERDPAEVARLITGLAIGIARSDELISRGVDPRGDLARARPSAGLLPLDLRLDLLFFSAWAELEGGAVRAADPVRKEFERVGASEPGRTHEFRMRSLLLEGKWLLETGDQARGRTELRQVVMGATDEEVMWMAVTQLVRDALRRAASEDALFALGLALARHLARDASRLEDLRCFVLLRGGRPTEARACWVTLAEGFAAEQDHLRAAIAFSQAASACEQAGCTASDSTVLREHQILSARASQGSPRGLYSLVEGLARVGRPDEAREALAGLVASPRSLAELKPGALEFLLTLLPRDGMLDDPTIPLAMQMIKTAPLIAGQMISNVSNSYAIAGRPERSLALLAEARQILAEAGATPSVSWWLLAAEAEVFDALGWTGEAAERSEQAFHLAAEATGVQLLDSNLRLKSCQRLARAGRFSEAIERCGTLAQASDFGTRLLAAQALAKALLALGRDDEAFQLMRPFWAPSMVRTLEIVLRQVSSAQPGIQIEDAYRMIGRGKYADARIGKALAQSLSEDGNHGAAAAAFMRIASGVEVDQILIRPSLLRSAMREFLAAGKLIDSEAVSRKIRSIPGQSRPMLNDVWEEGGLPRPTLPYLEDFRRDAKLTVGLAGTDPTVLVGIARLLISAGQVDEASRLLELVPDRSPIERSILAGQSLPLASTPSYQRLKLLAMTQLLVRKGDLRGAIAALEQARSAGPWQFDRDYFLLRAELRRMAGDADGSQADLEAAGAMTDQQRKASSIARAVAGLEAGQEPGPLILLLAQHVADARRSGWPADLPRALLAEVEGKAIAGLSDPSRAALTEAIHHCLDPGAGRETGSLLRQAAVLAAAAGHCDLAAQALEHAPPRTSWSERADELAGQLACRTPSTSSVVYLHALQQEGTILPGLVARGVFTLAGAACGRGDFEQALDSLRRLQELILAASGDDRTASLGVPMSLTRRIAARSFEILLEARQRGITDDRWRSLVSLALEIDSRLRPGIAWQSPHLTPTIFVPRAGELLWVFRASPRGMFHLTWTGGGQPRLALLDGESTGGRTVQPLVAALQRGGAYTQEWRALPAPLSAPLLTNRGTARWLILPDRELWQFPFVLLQSSGGPEAILVRSLLQRQRAPSGARLPLFAAGDPVLNNPSGSLATAARRQDLRPLAWSKPEIDAALSAVYQASVPEGASLTGERLSARTIVGLRLEQYRWLLFSTHASTAVPRLFDEPSPGLLLSFEPLKGDLSSWLAGDIRRTKLDAELVVLSACRTAVQTARSDIGIGGLAGAFLDAGARSVAATYWQVGDRDTADLSAGLFPWLAKGARPEQALAKARAALRAHSSHPQAWAAMVLIQDSP